MVMSCVAERAIALAVPCEIQRDDRYVLALGVGPDVGFGPMQDRMDAQMRARRRRGVELIPEFRRLVAHVPSAFGAARREHALLGAGRLFVARMPAIRPSKPYLASASFSPSVLRAADRAAGGKVGSTVSIGGHGSTFRSRPHSAP